jgi:hypothetical protein
VIEAKLLAPAPTAADDSATADGSTSPVDTVGGAETSAAPNAEPTSAAGPTIEPGSAGR